MTGASTDRPARTTDSPDRKDDAERRPNGESTERRDDALGIAAEKLGILYDSAIGRPVQGMAQWSNRILGTDFQIADAPAHQPQARNAADWHANVILENVGMLVPMLAANGVGRLGMMGLAGTARLMGATRFSNAVGAFESTAIGAFANSTSTGAIQGLLFQPTQTNSIGESFHNAAVGAITMGSLHTFSHGVARYGTPQSFTGLSGRLYQGTLGGVGAGFVGTEADSLLRTGSFTSANLGESMYGGAVAGFAIAGLAHRFIPIVPGERNIGATSGGRVEGPPIPPEYIKAHTDFMLGTPADQLRTLTHALQSNTPQGYKEALLRGVFDERNFMFADVTKPLFQTLPEARQMEIYHREMQRSAAEGNYRNWGPSLLRWLPENRQLEALNKVLDEVHWPSDASFRAKGLVTPATLLIREGNHLSNPAEAYQFWNNALESKSARRAAIEGVHDVPRQYAAEAWQRAWNAARKMDDPELHTALVGDLKIIPAKQRTALLRDQVLTDKRPLTSAALRYALNDGDPAVNTAIWHEVMQRVAPDYQSPVPPSGLNIESSRAIKSTPKRELQSFLSSGIENLPESQREAAFNLVAQRFPDLSFAHFHAAIESLPPSARGPASVQLIRSGKLPEQMPDIPVADRPAVLQAYLEQPNASTHWIKRIFPGYGEQLGPHTADAVSQGLRTLLGKERSENQSIARDWLQELYFRERGEGSVRWGDTFPVRNRISEQLTPQEMNRVIVRPENLEMADRVASEHPEAIRAAFRNFVMRAVDRNSEPIEARGLDGALAAWDQSHSLTQTVKAALNEHLAENSFSARGGFHDFAPDAMIGGLAKELPPAERRDALLWIRNELLSQSKWRESGRNSDRTREQASALINIAREIGQHEPEYYQTRVAQAIQEAFENPNNDYAWKLATANGIADIQRLKTDTRMHMETPVLRMPEVGNFSAEQKAALRGEAERALLSDNPEDAARLLGNGTLGRLFPSVFGDVSEGGMVGRRQHKEHDYPLHEHSLKVVEEVKRNPLYRTLSERDQVDTVWAALLHDAGKRSDVVDVGHESVSAGLAWGVLSTAGYHPARIQRIAKLITRDHDMSFDPNDAALARNWQDPRFVDDLGVYYRNPAAMTQLRILNESDIRSVHRDSHWWTPQVEGVIAEKVQRVEDRRRELSNNMLPLLTTEVPQGFQMRRAESPFALLAHVSDNLQTSFLRDLGTIQSQEYSMSTSLITNQHTTLLKSNWDLAALISGDYFDVSQAGTKNLGTGRGTRWSDHVELAKKFADPAREDALAIRAKAIAEESGVRDPEGRRTPLEYLRDSLAQFDTLEDLTRAANAGQPYAGFTPQQLQAFLQAQHGILHELTQTPLHYGGFEHNEVKLNNPQVVGIGMMRRGRPVFIEANQSDLPALQTLFGGQPAPSWLQIGGTAPENAITFNRTFWQDLQRMRLPIMMLD